MEKETIGSLSEAAIIKEVMIAKEDPYRAENTTLFQKLDLTSKLEVKTALSRFKTKKATGPDGIKTDVFKLGGEVFAETFVPLTNFILYTSYLPKTWKTDACFFLHKAGKDHYQASSNRPIMLFNIMGKLGKQLTLRRFTAMVEKLQSPFQQEFMRARGTATQILRTGKIIQRRLRLHDINRSLKSL
ncbi:RNA-directed DNA polymerase from mobile element jockey [Eumeta japonica]|uniref:RNA-directed DNA polymerase from mobile element jockey n=1 Tax=Eumeta variegata TaxID=151549 RepID=A0A4C1T3I3_EUMVA|nr:RNA-directed DNA polymerase from mobile element jockey [Eumeta japonica]